MESSIDALANQCRASITGLNKLTSPHLRTMDLPLGLDPSRTSSPLKSIKACDLELCTCVNSCLQPRNFHRASSFENFDLVSFLCHSRITSFLHPLTPSTPLSMENSTDTALSQVATGTAHYLTARQSDPLTAIILLIGAVIGLLGNGINLILACVGAIEAPAEPIQDVGEPCK